MSAGVGGHQGDGFVEPHALHVLGAEVEVKAVDGPGDAEGGIVPAQSGFGGRGVDVVDFVLEAGSVAEHKEAVGHAAGNEELAAVFMAELHHDVAPQRGRAAAQVDGDVDDAALRHPDELGLRQARALEVQAAEHSAGRLRLVVLNEVDGAGVCFEKVAAPRLAEVAPCVAMTHGLDDHAAIDVERDEFHD